MTLKNFNILNVIFLAPFLILGLSTSYAVSAHEPDRIGVVDVLEIINRGVAFQKLHESFSAIIAKDKTFFEGEEKKLREEESHFQADKTKINHPKTTIEDKKTLTEALVEKAAAHEKKVRILQNLVNKRKDQLDQAFTKARALLHGKMLEIIKSVALENKITVVIQMAQVLYQSENRDLSSMIIDRFNRDVPPVSINIESVEALQNNIKD